MSISSNFLISQLRTWFWSLGSLDSGLPPPRVPPHMPPPPRMPQLGLSLWPHGGHGGLPRLPGCRCLRAQAGHLLSQGGWRGSGEQRVAHRQRLWSAAGLHGKGSLESEEKRCLWGRDPYSAAPTALPGSTERTTVPSVSHSGHALSVLPHSLPHPVSPISSEARAPLPLTACACPPCQQLPCCPRGCQQPWNQQQKLISKEHLTPRWDRQGSGCRRRLPPALHHPASATGSSASEEPRPPGGRPPSAPEYSLVPLFLAH